jgi:hypothetical protein
VDCRVNADPAVAVLVAPGLLPRTSSHVFQDLACEVGGIEDALDVSLGADQFG